jgi:hypothetical protein
MRQFATFVAVSALALIGAAATPSTGRTEEAHFISARGHWRNIGPYYYLNEAQMEARYWAVRGHTVEIVGKTHHWRVKVWFRG